MKELVFIFAALLAASSAELDPRCTWGSSYWCSGLDEAKSCGAFSHCKSTAWKKEIIKQDGGDHCLYCTALIGDVKKFIELGKSEKEISHFLSSGCALLPGNSATKCKHVSESLVTEIMDLVNSGVEAHIVCSLMGVCSGMEDTVLHYPVSKPSEQNKPSAIKKLTPLVGIRDGQLCEDCKKFFKDIQQMIVSNATEEEIEQMIDQTICSELGSMEQECKNLVHEYLPEILKMISQYEDPAVICGALGVCSTQDKQSQYRLLLTRLRHSALYNAAASQNSATECLMCKAVMSEIQIIEKDKATQDKIIDLLKTQLCAHVGSLKDMCELGLTQYSAELFELLATFLEPTTRCRSLGFCDSTVNSVMPALPLSPAKRVDNSIAPASDPSPMCLMCEFAMKEIKEYIGQNATEEEIKQALEKVCSHMPESIKKTCTDFVDTYGPIVIEMIIHDLDPNVICVQIGLCKEVKRSGSENPAPREPLPPKNIPKAKVGDSETCTVCETLVQYLEALLDQGSSMEQIEAMLGKLCGYLPSSLQNECENLIKQYGDLIIHYISTLATPQEVCRLVGVCDDKLNSIVTDAQGLKHVMMQRIERSVASSDEYVDKREVKINEPRLGKDKCTWGPSHWCSSEVAAQKCNKKDYCLKNGWTFENP